MTKDEALQMCLEYIETDAHERKYVRHAIKAALEAKDEPVIDESAAKRIATALGWEPKRTWVGLTELEKAEITSLKWWDWEDTFDIDGFIKAIEAKLKEKNHDY
jgi:hypothetical protein